MGAFAAVTRDQCQGLLRKDIRRFASVLFVVVGALALATLRRPQRGYHSAGPLVLSSAIGAALAAALLLAYGAFVAVAGTPRQDGRTRQSRVRVRVITAFALLACALTALGLGLPTHVARRPRNPALEKAFNAWLPQVVPRVLDYTDAVRMLAPALKQLDDIHQRTAQQARRRLSGPAAWLVREQTHDRQIAQLRSLDAVFLTAVMRERAAAADYAALLTPRDRTRSSSAGTQARPARLLRLMKRAHEELVRAQEAMQRFTFAANGLGGRLAAGVP